MRQTLFMIGLMAIGALGGFVSPLLPLIPYYFFAIAQPQFLWEWALPTGIRWSFLAGAAALLFAFLHLPSLIRRVEFNPIAILLMAYATLLLLSMLAAHNVHIAQHWLVTVMKILVMAILTSLLIASWRHVMWLVILFVLCTAYLGWYYNSLYLFQGRLDILNQGHGVYDNNGAALNILLGLPILYAFAAHRLWLVRIAACIAAVLIVHAVMLSYSRGAMVAAVAGAAWLLWHHRPRWQTAAAIPVIVLVLAVLAGPEIRQEFRSIAEFETDATAQSRLTSWNVAWTLAWEHPLLGTGVRNSNLYTANYGADLRGRTIHNQYLQLAADSGIPALCVFLAMLLVVLLLLRRAAQQLGGAEAELKRQIQEEAEPDSFRLQRRHDLALYRHVCLGLQAAVVTFSAGAMFLSLETFEPAFLLLAIGGGIPLATRRLLQLEPSPADTPLVDPARHPGGPATPPALTPPRGLPTP